MSLVDFERDAEAARTAINQWVEKKTKQKIRNLIPPGSLPALTRLVLVNAVYFKGSWTLPFLEAATRDEQFFLDGGKTVQVPLMYQRNEVLYLQAEGYQAVDLTYLGGDLSMLVLLPDEQDGLRGLEERLSSRMLGECVPPTGRLT